MHICVIGPPWVNSLKHDAFYKHIQLFLSVCEYMYNIYSYDSYTILIVKYIMLQTYMFLDICMGRPMENIPMMHDALQRGQTSIVSWKKHFGGAFLHQAASQLGSKCEQYLPDMDEDIRESLCNIAKFSGEHASYVGAYLKTIKHAMGYDILHTRGFMYKQPTGVAKMLHDTYLADILESDHDIPSEILNSLCCISGHVNCVYFT